MSKLINRDDADLEMALEVYRRRIEALRVQAKEVAAQIANLEDTARRIERDLKREASYAPSETHTESSNTVLRSPETRNNGELVVELSRAIIREAGRPLSRQEILDGIEQRGVKLSVANPPKFVGKTLWAHPDFINIDRKGYALAHESYDEVSPE